MLSIRTTGIIGTLLVVLAGASSAPGYTPESNEVKGMVKRGLDLLEKQGDQERVGERGLVGLAFLKSGKPDHKLVQGTAKWLHDPNLNWGSVENYSLGIGIIFLSELTVEGDPSHLPLIQKLIDEMISRQKDHGGWGYDGHGNGSVMATGDISQTQYACLAMWSARNAGAKVPQAPVEKVCDWLLRVQDPSGGWSYQGNDPGPGKGRVPQIGAGNSITPVLTAAGLGSVCVCADMLGLHRAAGAEEEEEETGLPGALKVVKKPKPKVEVVAAQTKVDAQAVDRSIEDGSRWFAQNYVIQVDNWNFYYLYGLERCESFRELYYRKFQKEPRWYNDGVAFLGQRLNQGGWVGDHSPAVSTAFAVLFLQRSARKSIAKKHQDLGEGVLTSGKGLPTDLANASVKRGKLVDSPLAGEVDDLLAMLEDPENPELSRILESNENLKLDSDLTKRKSQITKLRSMVSAGNWEARMVAVRALGTARELDNVPVLLYALTDPDVRVIQEADAALRFISRKFQGVGLPAEPTTDDMKQARQAWRAWYLSIRPNAELID